MKQFLSLFSIGIMLSFVPIWANESPALDQDQVDELFSRWDRPDSPGCAVGIYHSGAIVYENGYGSANLDYVKPITPETVFYIGSVSKQFTAAAIAILADRGDISLNDDVRKYIPELPEYERPISVQDLIYHTSGLRDLYALMTIADIDVAGVISIDDKLDLIRRQEDLNFLPGDEYLYSNSGYTLMAILVQRVSGKSLREFTRQNIFEPLGMNNTHFHDNRQEVVRNRALSYQQDNEDKFKLSYLTNFEGVGPGGLYTTVGDLYLWDQNYSDNRLNHSPNFHEIMYTKGLLTDGDTLDYAFGLRFDEYKGLSTVGHGGSFMGFRAHYERIPDHNYAHTILCNLGSINPGDISRQIIDIYLRKKIEENLGEFTGAYGNPDFGVSCNITIKEGNLFVTEHSLLEGTLEYSDVDSFRRGGWEIEFIRDNRNEVKGFMLSTSRARNIYFEKL